MLPVVTENHFFATSFFLVDVVLPLPSRESHDLVVDAISLLGKSVQENGLEAGGYPGETSPVTEGTYDVQCFPIGVAKGLNCVRFYDVLIHIYLL